MSPFQTALLVIDVQESFRHGPYWERSRRAAVCLACCCFFQLPHFDQVHTHLDQSGCEGFVC